MEYNDDTYYHLSVVETESNGNGESEITNEIEKSIWDTEDEVASHIKESVHEWDIIGNDTRHLEMNVIGTEDGEWSVQTKPIDNILLGLL